MKFAIHLSDVYGNDLVPGVDLGLKVSASGASVLLAGFNAALKFAGDKPVTKISSDENFTVIELGGVSPMIATLTLIAESVPEPKIDDDGNPVPVKKRGRPAKQATETA